jgi:hypothetical protein
MKNYLIIPALIAILFAACKEKKEAKQELAYFCFVNHKRAT